MPTMKKEHTNFITLLVASKDLVLEVSVDKTKYCIYLDAR